MRTVRLGDVVSIRAVQIDPREPEYARLPLVNGENVVSGRCRLAFRRTAAEGGVISPKYLFRERDVLYSKLRPYLRKCVVADSRGMCSADMYPLTVDSAELDPHWLAWLLVADEFTTYANNASARARMPKLNRDQLLAYEFMLPSLDQQHFVADRVARDTAAVDAIEAHVENRRRHSTALLGQLINILTTESRTAPVVELQTVACSLPSPSTTADGDARVLTITSGCLQPSGFDVTGLRPNRMHAAAAKTGRVYSGEVLVGRSNTEEFVGRAALFSGEVPGVVATDLIYRFRPRDDLVDAGYLAGYLSALQLSGFWRHRSSGASSTMKKITRTQVNAVLVPAPPITEQRRIAAELRERLTTIDQMTRAIDAQLEAIEALPAALLRRAFEQIEAA